MAEELQGDIRPYATEEDVKSMVYDLYGMKVLKIKKLNGYDDQNFHVMVDVNVNENTHVKNICSLGYVFKILNTVDSMKTEHISAQIALLSQISSRGVVCPLHIKDKNGEVFTVQPIPDKERTGSNQQLIRMLEYLEGDIAINIGINDEIAIKGGKFVSEFCEAVQGFTDKGLAKDDYLWNLTNLHMIEQYLDAVENAENRQMAGEVIQKWATLKDDFAQVDDVVVHSDINEQNLLVRKEDSGELDIVGILDFQDTSFGKKTYDIGIFIAYMMIYYKGDRIHCGGLCLRGFLEKANLTDAELTLVYYSAVGRLVQTLVMGAYNYAIHHDPYILSTSGTGWEALKALWEKPAHEVVTRWRSIANSQN